MHTCCKALLAGVVMMSCFAPQARAMDVYCANCSTVTDQLRSYLEQGRQYATELSAYSTQLRQYANMVQNTVALPMMVWNNARSDIAQVNNIINAAGMLGGNAGGYVSQLSQLGSFANQIASLSAMQNQWQQMAGVTAQDTEQLQTALGLNEAQRANATALLQADQINAATAVGQMQILQASAQISSLSAEQLMTINQQLSTQTRLFQDQATLQATRTATDDEKMNLFRSGYVMPPNTGNAQY